MAGRLQLSESWLGAVLAAIVFTSLQARSVVVGSTWTLRMAAVTACVVVTPAVHTASMILAFVSPVLTCYGSMAANLTCCVAILMLAISISTCSQPNAS